MYHQSRNATKDKYYEGHVTLQDVNLGLALPQGLRGLEVGCNWGQKAVDALASRSMFDGFVSNGRRTGRGCKSWWTDNRLVAAYAKACRDQLKYGCVFATLSADADIGCRIRFHSPCCGRCPVERRERPDRLRPCHHRHHEGRKGRRTMDPVHRQLLYRRPP